MRGILTAIGFSARLKRARRGSVQEVHPLRLANLQGSRKFKCEGYGMVLGLVLMLPSTLWSEAAVVDESENFANFNEQQSAQAPTSSKYDLGSSDEGPALVSEDALGDSNSEDKVTLIAQIQALQKELQELRGQLEVQAHDLKLLQQQQSAFYDQSNQNKSTNLDPITPAQVPQAATVAKAWVDPASVSAQKTGNSLQPDVASRSNPADEQISYLAAYELIKGKQFDKARQAMQLFVQKYPQGGYTANAQYWLGELYLVEKDYPKAIEHFEVVLNQFPASSKSAASMLKIGYAYAAMGKHQQASKTFQQLLNTYPNTPTARLALEKLKTLGT